MECFYILLAFLLITIALLIVTSISWFIKHQSKHKHLLLYHEASDKLKEIEIDNIT